MKKIFISVIVLSMFLSACGKTSSSSINQEDTSLNADLGEVTSNTSSVDTQNISTGYIITNSQDYVELYSDIQASNIISRMYNAEPVTVYSIQGDWANISYGGMVGYVKLQNISFSKPVATENVITTNETIITQETTVEKLNTTERSQSNEQVQLNQNIEQSVNIVFLCDSDGFEVAQPVSYPSYVSDSRDAWCSATSIYIYSQPDTNSSKREADMLYYGDTLTILGSVDNWYYIATDSGNGYDLHGYVKQKYITIGQTPVAPEPAHATHGRVSAGSANVRSSPNKETDSNILFTVYQGSEFDVLDYDGYWYKIDYNGTICYISHKMVEVW